MNDQIRFLFCPEGDVRTPRLMSCPHYMFDQYVHALLGCTSGGVKVVQRFSLSVKAVGSDTCSDLLVYEANSEGKIVDMTDDHIDLFLDA